MASDIDRRQFTETFRLAQPETLWSPRKLSSEELLAGKRDALRLSLDDQLRAGIDIVSDGEQTRQHFVTTFIEHLSGVDFAKREIVKIRNRYEASVPTVGGRRGAPETGLRGGRSLSAAAHQSADQMGASGPDDHDRHAV